MTVELVLLITLVSGVLAYFVGRYDKLYGAVVTIVASMFVFLSVAYMAQDIDSGTTFNYSKVLNTSSWLYGVYDIEIKVADSHTVDRDYRRHCLGR